MELFSNLNNVSFSNAVQTCTINVPLDDIYSNGHSYSQGWGGVKKIGVCFELQNVSFSTDRKIDVDQNCIINVSLDERHPIMVTCTRRGGVGSRNSTMFLN